MSGAGWPTATLSEVARLRVLAAGLPGVALVERVIDQPFEQVWDFVSDLERSVPTFDRTVTSLRVHDRRGGRLEVTARTRWGPLRFPTRFEVALGEGWCWMVTRPRFYVVGMAAVPEGERTRFAHLEGVARPVSRPLLPVLRPLLVAGRPLHRRHVRSDLDGIERALAQSG